MTIKVKVKETKTYQKEGKELHKDIDLKYIQKEKIETEAYIMKVCEEARLLIDYPAIEFAGEVERIIAGKKVTFGIPILESIVKSEYKVGKLFEEKTRLETTSKKEKIELTPGRFAPRFSDTQDIFTVKTERIKEAVYIPGTGTSLYPVEFKELAKSHLSAIKKLEDSLGSVIYDFSQKEETLISWTYAKGVEMFFKDISRHLDTMYKKVQDGLYKDAREVFVQIGEE